MALGSLKMRMRSLSVSLKRKSTPSVFELPQPEVFNPDFALVFPVDITRKIFTLCCSTDYEHRVDEFTQHHTFPFHYTIATVSHAWRIIICQECPLLWNRIHITLSPFMPLNVRNHLAFLLACSGDAQLDIILLAIEAPRSRMVKDPDIVMDAFLKLREDICVMLLSTSHRWKRLCIDPGAFMPRSLASMRGRLPNLEELVVDCHLDGDHIQRDELDMEALVNAPVLHTVELRNVLSYKLPWANLANLIYVGEGDGKIKSSEYFYLHAAISSAVGLHYLELANIQVPPSLSDQCIRSLSIQHVYIHDSDMWRVLQLPCVWRVNIMCSDLDKLAAFVMRSQCCVSTLRLLWFGGNVPAPPFFNLPASLLQSLDRLRSLAIEVDPHITRQDSFVLDIFEKLNKTEMLPYVREIRLHLTTIPGWKPTITVITHMHAAILNRRLSHLGVYVNEEQKRCRVPATLSQVLPPVAIAYLMELRRFRSQGVGVDFMTNGHDIL